MASMVEGLGFDWAVEKTAACIKELVEMTRPREARADGELNFDGNVWTPPPISLTNKSGDSLDHLADGSMDCIVMDPPYYDNVMYAEL